MSDVDRASAVRKARREFSAQRWMARKRGIDWFLSYPEWCRIWRESGKYSQRGSRAGCFVMGRLGDAGPYAVGNVEIVSVGDNCRRAVFRKDGSNRFAGSRRARFGGSRRALSPDLVGAAGVPAGGSAALR